MNDNVLFLCNSFASFLYFRLFSFEKSEEKLERRQNISTFRWFFSHFFQFFHSFSTLNVFVIILFCDLLRFTDFMYFLSVWLSFRRYPRSSLNNNINDISIIWRHWIDWMLCMKRILLNNKFLGFQFHSFGGWNDNKLKIINDRHFVNISIHFNFSFFLWFL